MMKKIVIFTFMLIFGLGAVLTADPGLFASATVADSFMIRAYGDSISCGDGLDDANDAYPAVFANPYLSGFGGSFEAKGVSGDKSNDLLEDLTPYIDGTAEDMQVFEDTDVVTLCIGANNVLEYALDNLGDYLQGTLTDADYRALLKTGVDQFQNDYPQILDAFEGKKVVVMTVYNPYKYLTLNDVSHDESLQGFEMYIDSALSSFETNLQNMIVSSMDYLNGTDDIVGINQIIRDSASEDVIVVDIWEMFDEFTKDEYLQYINADMSKVVLTYNDASALLAGNKSSIMTKFKANCDPHPTQAGHEVIANKHLETFKYYRLSTTGDFASLKDASDSISFKIDTIETDADSYKLYKENAFGKTILKESTEKNISVLASQIAGDGKIYVEVYKDGNKIYKTNSIDYNVTLNAFSISSDISLTGVQDSGDVATISITATETNGYTFKYIRQVGGDVVTLEESTSTSITIEVDELVEEGVLYVEVYRGTELVFTTNQLEFGVTLNAFSLACTVDLENAILDEIDEIEFLITAENYSDYSFKFYKMTEESPVLLQEGTSRSLKLSASNLVGSGKIYAEIYKASTKLYTTNEIEYSVSLNTFSISVEEELSGYVGKTKEIVVNVETLKEEGYTFSLIAEIDETPTLIKESSTSIIKTTADKLEGKGKLYVKVFKNSTEVCTTNSIDFDLIVGIFQISTNNSTNIEDKEEIINIVVNSHAVPNAEYRLFKIVEGNVTSLQSNTTGRFSVEAVALKESSGLYVEVYSDGQQVATTNTLYFNIEFATSRFVNEKVDNLILYITLCMIAVTMTAFVVVVLLRIKNRNSF